MMFGPPNAEQYSRTQLGEAPTDLPAYKYYYLERAADQCSSIALLMLARENESIKKNHHAYLQSLHSDGGAEYEAAIAARRKQYLDRLSKTPQ